MNRRLTTGGFLQVALAVFISIHNAQSAVAQDARTSEYTRLVAELVSSGGKAPVGNRIDQLDGKGVPLDVGPLLPLLRNDNWSIRKEAAYAIRLMGNRGDACGALLEAAQREGNDYVLTEMVQGLGAARCAGATQLLSTLMTRHAQSFVRYAAVEAESWSKDVATVPSLIQATYDADQEVSSRAVYVLGGIGAPAALPRLRQIAFGSRTPAQLNAIQALGVIRDRDAGEGLVRLASSDNDAIVKGAIWSLGMIRYAEAVPLLTPLLESQNKTVQDEAYAAMALIGNQAVMRIMLSKYAIDGNKDARRAIMTIYTGHKSEYTNEIARCSPETLQSLASALSRAAPSRVRPAAHQSISPGEIRVLTSIDDWAFIEANYGYSGNTFLAKRTATGTWECVSEFGGWIE